MLPDLYFFNATSEMAIANGSPFYTPPARLLQMERELSYLPGWLAEDKDFVLIRGEKHHAFESKMASLGFRLPGFLRLDELLHDQAILDLPKGRLMPWGWSPHFYRMVEPIISSCSEVFRESVMAKWQPFHRELFSRLTAVKLLQQLLGRFHNAWLSGQDAVPMICDSLGAVHAAINRLSNCVVKTPWSASGRGLLRFPNVDSVTKNNELLRGMLQQGIVTVEPWHEREMDLSFQFLSIGGEIQYQGMTIFETDHRGRYLRTFLTEKIADEVCGNFLEAHKAEVVGMLQEVLSGSAYASDYEGWIGVDAMIISQANGSLGIHPMVEINGRFTMGALALKLSEKLMAGSSGYLEICSSKKTDFHTFCQQREQANPLHMESGRIVSGFLPLVPSKEGQQFGAFVEVRSDEL